MTRITKKPFGMTKAGVPVELYTLDDGMIRVQVMTLGGTVVSVEAPDKRGRMADVCLGFDSPQEYEAQTCYIGATVGRYANRIGGARFTLNGTEYLLYPNDGENHLHGGPHGFHTKVWNAAIDGDALVLSCESADMEEGYPGKLLVSVRYTLCGGTLTLSYHAKCDRDTVINLTNHAYFNLAGQDSGTVLDQCIRINAFREAACAFDPQSGRMLTVKTDLPGMQFYAGNSLDGTLCGKNGTRYVRRSGFCLETQFFPDTPNQPSFPSCVLRAGEDFCTKTSYTFAAVNEI